MGSDPKRHPAGDAPHVRGPGVTEGVGVCVAVGVYVESGVEVTRGLGDAASDGDSVDEGRLERVVDSVGDAVYIVDVDAPGDDVSEGEPQDDSVGETDAESEADANRDALLEDDRAGDSEALGDTLSESDCAGERVPREDALAVEDCEGDAEAVLVMHTVEPETLSVHMLNGHGVQADADVSPVVLLNVLGGHGTRTPVGQ